MPRSKLPSSAGAIGTIEWWRDADGEYRDGRRTTPYGKTQQLPPE
ncbi:MAG TPA: hypothetical protein VMR62_23600 [Bryobacteraceae bacterium]|nr:hypothetical protein [Bryobacteraceae bacterium]